jgi:hypothetical protein
MGTSKENYPVSRKLLPSLIEALLRIYSCPFQQNSEEF